MLGQSRYMSNDQLHIYCLYAQDGEMDGEPWVWKNEEPETPLTRAIAKEIRSAFDRSLDFPLFPTEVKGLRWDK